MEQEPEQTPEEQSTESQESAPEPSTPDAEAETGLDQKEIDEGKAFAVLSYALNIIGLPFFAVPLIMRNNAFSLYHAKQCLIVWLMVVVVSFVNIIPCIGQIIWVAALVFAVVLNILGIMAVTSAKVKPLPLLGKWAVDWFKSITKV